MAASALRSSVSHALRSASAIFCKPVSGSHVLRIDGYSHLKDEIPNGQRVSSCDFRVAGHIWRLLCYPNADDPYFKDHIALYLQLASEPKVGELVSTRTRFDLLDRLGNPALPKDPGIRNFSCGTSLGIHKFVSRSELEKSEYLEDERFAIQCYASVTTAVWKCSDHWSFISQNSESNAA